MPITVSWHNEAHTILYLGIRDPWTLTDLGESIEASYTMMRSTDAEVDTIWDASETSGIPRNVLSYFMLRGANLKVPANQRAVVVVARSAFLKSFLSASRRALSSRTRMMYIVDDLEAAERCIESLRQPVTER
jgi:hypothetical protein